MAGKEFTLDDGMAVTIFKRRGSRNLRITLAPHGKVRVTIPAWAPYRAGLEFAKSKKDWIEDQQKPVVPLANGQAIGKAHHLHFVAQPGNTVTTRISGGEIIVKYPAEVSRDHPEVQRAAREAGVRALRRQAEALLPKRLEDLALENSFNYSKVSIKRLKGRWGSCDHNRNIVLNLFLMQLPWELIDYVLLHELVHTRVLRHGPDFWKGMSDVLPDYKELRKQLKEYSPALS